MACRDRFRPAAAMVLALVLVFCSAPAEHPSAAHGSATPVGVRPLAPAQSAPPGKPPRDDANDAEVLEAVGAVERAGAYTDMVAAVERYEDVIAGSRTVALVDRALETAEPGSERRALLILERQLSIDCREHGARAAARLLGIRLVAASALAADSPEQFATVLERFAPLANEMDAGLVREALAAPTDTWPPALLPLMEQLAVDWPASGALAAANRMAQTAGASRTGATGAPASLPGHWRSTEIVFESPRDEHLVLHGDGTAETWTVTASGRTPAVRGRWATQASTLTVDWEDGRQWAQPFTFHEGSLVFPNVEGRRQFWERIQ